MQEPQNTEDTRDSTEPVAQLIFDSVGPAIQEFLSHFVVVGYRADNGEKVIVSNCTDHSIRSELKNVLIALEEWGGTTLYDDESQSKP